MANNYGGRPLVAIAEDDESVVWETPDHMFQVRHSKLFGQFEIAEKFLTRIADAPMKAQWVLVLTVGDKQMAQEVLNVHLYPMGSEPSPEYAGIGNDPRTVHDDTPDEWLTPAEYFGDAT